MNKLIDEMNWAKFLREYSERNAGRPTRLGVCEMCDGAVEDYWIEDGLPLIAADVYPHHGTIKIDLFFKNYTHSVDAVSELFQINDAGAESGVDIVDAGGKTTVLRIEDWKLSNQE